MYLIIIEGTDNIGKDTLKDRLIDIFDIVTIIHCSAPKSAFFKNKEQDKKFIEYANDIVNGVYDNAQCLVMNRSHYGEYVYGQLYRKRNKEDILKMIYKVDDILRSRRDLTIKYIQLISSSIDLRIKNEDGKSLSNMNYENMETETNLFKEIYALSGLDKLIIDVNDGNDNFKSKDEIYNEVIEFLEK